MESIVHVSEDRARPSRIKTRRLARVELESIVQVSEERARPSVIETLRL